MTVGQAFGRVACHPIEHLVLRWNWKAALLSAITRGAIFFTVNLTVGWPAALRALGFDIPLRLAVAGFSGAITQAFRHAEPVWAASLTIVAIFALLTHGLEFVVHTLGGTPRLALSMLVSVLFSAISGLVNLALMRRGVLLVGREGRPLPEDLRRVAGLLADLVRSGWNALARVTRFHSTSTRRSR